MSEKWKVFQLKYFLSRLKFFFSLETKNPSSQNIYRTLIGDDASLKSSFQSIHLFMCIGITSIPIKNEIFFFFFRALFDENEFDFMKLYARHRA